MWRPIEFSATCDIADDDNCIFVHIFVRTLAGTLACTLACTGTFALTNNSGVNFFLIGTSGSLFFQCVGIGLKKWR